MVPAGVAFHVVGLVFERYYNELLGFLARHMGGDRDAASDVAQETLLRAWALHAGSTSDSVGPAAVREPRALLYRIARNLVIDLHRQRQRQGRGDEVGIEGVDVLAPDSDEPEVIHASRQRTAALLQAIEALTPRCREAFVLHKFDGLSHAEVAQRMGISRNMVEKHVIRAMLACRCCLAQWDGDDANSGRSDDV